MSSAIDDALADVELDSVPEDEEAPKRTRRPRSDKGQPRTGGTRRVSNRALIEDLLIPYAGIAQGFAFISPTGAALLLTRGEKSVEALVKIASRNPKMLAALKKGSTVAPVMELGTTVIQFFMAVMLDMGRMPVEHPMAQMMGLSELYMEVHPDQAVPEQGNPMNGQGFPGGFAPFIPAQGG